MIANTPAGHKLVELFSSKEIDKVLFKKINNIVIDSILGFKSLSNLNKKYKTIVLPYFRKTRIIEVDKLNCSSFIKELVKCVIFHHSRKY